VTQQCILEVMDSLLDPQPLVQDPWVHQDLEVIPGTR